MFRHLILTMLTFGLAFGAQANHETEALVQSAAMKMQERSGKEMARVVVDYVDVSKTAGFVLGKHALGLPIAERVAFETRFENFLLSVLAERAWQLSDAEITVIGSTDRRGTESIVTTRVKTGTNPSRIMRWRLIRDGDTWRAVDLQVGGLWLAVEQRAQIDIVLGYDDVEVSDLYDVEGGGQDELLSASTRNTGGGRRVVQFLDRVLP